jgi:hypothetical protein
MFACGKLQVFHFGDSNFHYQFVFKWFHLLHYVPTSFSFSPNVVFFEFFSYITY